MMNHNSFHSIYLIPFFPSSHFKVNLMKQKITINYENTILILLTSPPISLFNLLSIIIGTGSCFVVEVLACSTLLISTNISFKSCVPFLTSCYILPLCEFCTQSYIPKISIQNTVPLRKDSDYNNLKF